VKKQWVDLSRQEVIDLCDGKSYAQVAREFGITQPAVSYRMRMFGIRRYNRRTFVPPFDELKRLYETMTMASIARHYGVGETVVFKRIKEYGFPLITKSTRLKGKPKTLEHRLAMSRGALASGVRAGKRNGNWKGGKSGSNRRARSKAAYHEWKAAVLKNANWRCQKCGLEHYSICDHCGHKVRLHAHHIEPFMENESLRYDPKNGEALCDRCHWMEHQENRVNSVKPQNGQHRAKPQTN
jgi:transposase-like protein